MTVDDIALDETIVDGLHQVAEALKLDHAILWHKPLDHAMPPPYSWSRLPQSPGAALEMSSLLLIATKLDAGGTACFTHLEDVPGAGETLRRQGMRSLAVIPVEASGGDALARGALAFSSRAVDRNGILWQSSSSGWCRASSVRRWRARRRRRRHRRSRRAGVLESPSRPSPSSRARAAPWRACRG